jgi:aryl-alcohol dehydrogenase-like predicted oxidoreductase
MGGSVETWGHVDDRESIAAIHQAIDLGINLIDTAPVYGLGHSEEIVGKALQGRRHQVILATKCGLLFPRSKDEPPRRSLSSESIFRECEQSLRRLRSNCIDLYQCHWPDPQTPLTETMDALMTLRDQQKIRVIGVSNFSCEEIAAAREYAPLHSLQAPFSMLQRRTAESLVPFCMEHDMALLAYSPLSKGLLTGKFKPGDRLEGIRARDPDFLGSRFLRNLRLVDRLREVADRYSKTLTQVVINWTVNYPGVTAAIVGAKRASQVAENAGGVGWRLSPDDHSSIGAMLAEFEATD